ncbi:response regulator [Hydrogenophaga sp. BPS33]|uniref:response regulator n=1 Tax=Hydrogenophaga sp. BPS33 TaxID=2651974 RepID=UPI00132005BB|nr:response regulator [Hydrogenophaga sp. BPS33]QHE86728.1 response regulator [Hydrogenophaga sp. BPS33]
MPVPERFLLVDDNEADNVYHEIVIRRAGFTGEVRVFESGEAALKFLLDDPLSRPSCLLLDINMPHMNGFEFARLATALLKHKATVQVQILTSSDAPQDLRRASDVPLIQGFITKPLTRERVQALLGHPPAPLRGFPPP